MIETIAKIWMIFGGIIALGLLVTWLNDRVESWWNRDSKPLGVPALGAIYKPRYQVKVYQIPSPNPQTLLVSEDLAKKIVRIDFNQGRPLKEDLGSHVRVLSKAA